MGFSLIFDEFVIPSSFDGSLLVLKLKNTNGLFEYPDLSSASISSKSPEQLDLTFPQSDTRFTDTAFLRLYQDSLSGGAICFALAPAFISDVTGNSYASDPMVSFSASGSNFTACSEECPANTYPSGTECLLCHPQCAGPCNGPTNEDCVICLEIAVEMEDGGVQCVGVCPFGFSYNSIAGECQFTL